MEDKVKDYKSFGSHSDDSGEKMPRTSYNTDLANTAETNVSNLQVNRCYLAMLCSFSTIGGFLFGYDTSVIAGANLYISDSFDNVTDLDKEVVVSLTLLGAAIGSVFGGPLADQFGRKLTIFVADVLFTAG